MVNEANAHPGPLLAAAHLPAPAGVVEPTPPLPAGPWTVGERSRRRLTEAGLARVAALLAEGKSDGQIAAEMGITRRAVELRRKNGTESAATWAATPQPERDLARAEKNREYQREWYRKRRQATAAPAPAEDGVNPKMAEPALAEVRTVVVVPAAVVPAPRIPPPPSTLVMASRVPEVAARIAPPPPPKPKAEPQIITTTPKDVRAWLIAAMKAGGLSLVQAQDRVGFMTHDQALTEANQRRARAGHPPFAFIGARSAA